MIVDSQAERDSGGVGGQRPMTKQSVCSGFEERESASKCEACAYESDLLRGIVPPPAGRGTNAETADQPNNPASSTS